MLKYLDNIKILHIEPTNICQAACPACAREVDLDFDKSIHKSLTVNDLKNILPDAVIANLNKMYLCGTYGDPAAGHALEIYQYFRNINNNITLGMNTNGALQSTSWWHMIGKILNRQQDFVVFSIDGLQDTNHIYRKNVIWDKLLSNIQAFINAGGNAHWDMLIYKHNEHQVDQCEQLAKNLGFKWFRAKVSRRPLVAGLEHPVKWLTPTQSAGKIQCKALEEKSLYIDCNGIIHPCCWLGGRVKDFLTFEDVMPTWNTNPHPICKASCSDQANEYRDQWKHEIEIN